MNQHDTILNKTRDQAHRRRVARVGLVLGLAAVIAVGYATLTPGPGHVVLSDGRDKVYHFIAFFCIVFPLIATDPRRWAWVMPVAIGYGGAIELIQPHVGRSAEWLDFGANITGVLSAMAMGEVANKWLRRRFPFLDPKPASAVSATEEERLEAMRAELMKELRVVLREELSQSGASGSRGTALWGRRHDDENSGSARDRAVPPDTIVRRRLPALDLDDDADQDQPRHSGMPPPTWKPERLRSRPRASH